MTSYKIMDKFLHDGEGWEVRKYKPHKRTVWIGGRDYFLQFPWLVFMNLRSKSKSYLALAFAKEDDSLVYSPMLPHCCIDYSSKLWIICLGRGYDNDDDNFRHYCHPSKFTFDDLVNRFWTSRFDAYEYWYFNRDVIRAAFGATNPIHKWQNSNLDEILGSLQGPIELEEFILNTTCAIIDLNAQR